MSMIVFSPFGGVAPKLDPLALPEPMAQQAENCRISSGKLEAFKAPLQVYDPTTPNVRTIYRFGQAENSDTDYWFSSQNVVDFVKGAIANDTEERTFYTGDGYPKVTKSDMALTSRPYPANSYRLGTPAPSMAPVVAVSGSPSSPTAIAETRFYVFTYVDVLGGESAPSEPSNEVTFYDGQTASIQIGGVPAGPFNVTHKRIYRTSVGSASTEYLFVAEVPVATGAYDDTVDAANLGELLPSLEYALLPDDARGLASMPNGMMAAHTKYDVYFCVPFKPYAYPVGYMQTVDYPIVGQASFGSSLAVLTTGVPYIMSGTDPSSISVEKLAVPYACLSKRSIVSALGGVVYASPDGLVSIDHGGPKVLTEPYFTRREWQALNPASMLCAVWDERVFMFYDTGTVKGGYILDGEGLTTTDVHATAAFTDSVTGSLFLCVDDKIVKWDAGLQGSFIWRSRRVMAPAPKNFAFGHVLATAYPLTAEVFADGVLVHLETVADKRPFRLPGGFKASDWEIRLSGSAGRVSMAVLADTAEELKRV